MKARLCGWLFHHEVRYREEATMSFSGEPVEFTRALPCWCGKVQP